MNKTFMYEIAGGIIAVALSTAVGNLYLNVDTNTKQSLKNKDDIQSSKEIGDAEIKRSTAIDEQGRIERDENKAELKEQDDFLHRIDKEVASLRTAVQYIHGGGELNHQEGKGADGEH